MFSIFRQPIQGLRRPAGAYVNGLWVANPDPEPITIRASIQPASGSQLARLPEGKRTNPTYALRSEEAIQEAIADSHDADVFDFYGRRWEVIDLRTWQNGIINHYEALVQGSQYGLD
jgi:hypothetical protein